MSAPILAHKVTNVSAQAHVCRRTLLKTPLLSRESFEKVEAFAVNQVLTQQIQAARKLWKREVGLRVRLMEE
jgi:hypothetical protein